MKLSDWQLKQLKRNIRCRTKWRAIEVEPDEHPEYHVCGRTADHPGYCKCRHKHCKAMHIDHIDHTVTNAA